MIVGMLRVVLAIPEARSLKDKRQVVRRVLDRTRAKFNVAAAEVGMLDVHRHAELGFVLVSNDKRHMQSMVDHVSAFVSQASGAIVEQRGFAIEHRDDLEGGLVDSGAGVEYESLSGDDE